MHHARNGRYGLLREGGPSRKSYSRSFNRAFVLRSQLLAERNNRLDRVSASATVNTVKVIKSAPIGNLTVTLPSSSGQIKHSGDEFFVTFKDSSGKPVDVGAAALTFHMPQMASMAPMNDPATLTTTDMPGVYR